MKHLSKFFAVFLALTLSCSFIGCSDDSSSDDNSSSNSSQTAVSNTTYRGTMQSSSETVYIAFTFTDGSHWSSQGYTDSNFTTTTQPGTTSGTYIISENTITIHMTEFNTTLTGTTSDDWTTIVCSGEQMFTGTLTKQ